MKCAGCGIKLQITDPKMVGYIKADVLSDLNEESYCERCYQIMHYGLHYDPIISNKEYYNKIDTIKNKKAIVVLMVDVLNIYASFIPRLASHIGDNPLIICLNKTDIIPKDVHLKNIESLVKSIAEKEGLNLSSCVMISAKKEDNVLVVLNRIEKLKKKIFKESGKIITDTFVLGCASTGKSTFLNTIRKIYKHHSAPLTVSSQYQTTLDFIKIALDKTNYIIDTPGFINYESYGTYLNYKDIELITPKTYLKPTTFQLNGDQTIFIGGLVRLDFESENKLNASFYVSNDLHLHRTKTINATSLYEEHKGKLLAPPDIDHLDKLGEMKENVFSIKDGTYDLIINGLGFVHLNAKDLKIKVTIPKNVGVKLVETFF